MAQMKHKRKLTQQEVDQRIETFLVTAYKSAIGLHELSKKSSPGYILMLRQMLEDGFITTHSSTELKNQLK
jgi:hypothetical protein